MPPKNGRTTRTAAAATITASTTAADSSPVEPQSTVVSTGTQPPRSHTPSFTLAANNIDDEARLRALTTFRTHVTTPIVTPPQAHTPQPQSPSTSSALSVAAALSSIQ